MATVVITGTSTGIGMATALVLGRAGHVVVATMRSPDKSPELMSIAAKEKLEIEVVALDVDSDSSVRSGVDAVFAKHGRVDVLVNNAGLGISGPVEELPLSEFRRAMETNFFGALRCIQAVLPSMRERRSGCIVNVTSVAGRLAIAPQGPYAASKFALEALSEVLAQEVKAFNIRVAIVEPGVIETPIFGKQAEIPKGTRYPHARRIRALFAASLEKPVSAQVVGDQIREIVEGQSWQLRYPVGPDAVPVLKWRAGMSDEQWVDHGAVSDEEWCARTERDFHLDVRSKMKQDAASSS